MATYIIRRKGYSAVVRNPYNEMREMRSRNLIMDEEAKTNDTPELAKYIEESNKTPVYQNINDKTSRYIKANNAISKDRKDRSIKNQNININKTTNINNPSKERASELDAQVKMSKMRQQGSDGNSVNEKLIEIQKTNPLKPLSMNGRN